MTKQYEFEQAIREGNVEAVKLLLADKRVDPGAAKNWAIGWASSYGDTEIVKLLLTDDRVDPTNGDNYAIRLASRKGYLDIVKLLEQVVKERDTMTNNLGKKLKKHRIEKWFSLDKLAKLTESSKSYLWELENCDTLKPSAEKLTVIAQALGVTTDYLLDDKAIADGAVLQEAFFRKFNQLKEGDKQKIEQMIEAWGE